MTERVGLGGGARRGHWRAALHRARRWEGVVTKPPARSFVSQKKSASCADRTGDCSQISADALSAWMMTLTTGSFRRACGRTPGNPSPKPSSVSDEVDGRCRRRERAISDLCRDKLPALPRARVVADTSCCGGLGHAGLLDLRCPDQLAAMAAREPGASGRTYATVVGGRRERPPTMVTPSPNRCDVQGQGPVIANFCPGFGFG